MEFKSSDLTFKIFVGVQRIIYFSCFVFCSKPPKVVKMLPEITMGGGGGGGVG